MRHGAALCGGRMLPSRGWRSTCRIFFLSFQQSNWHKKRFLQQDRAFTLKENERSYFLIKDKTIKGLNDLNIKTFHTATCMENVLMRWERYYLRYYVSCQPWKQTHVPLRSCTHIFHLGVLKSFYSPPPSCQCSVDGYV